MVQRFKLRMLRSGKAATTMDAGAEVPDGAMTQKAARYWIQQN